MKKLEVPHKKVTVQVPPDMYAMIEHNATNGERSINREMLRLVRIGMKTEGAQREEKQAS